MPCNQSNYTNQGGASTSTSNLPTSPSRDGSRVLIVSDAPERIPQETGRTSLPLLSGAESVTSPTGLNHDTNTLYKCSIPLDANTGKDFRLFFSHESHLSSNAYICVVASLSTDTSATVSDFHCDTTTTIYPGGKCLAKAQLYGTLASVTPTNSSLTKTEKTIWQGQIVSEGFLAGVMEFSITASASCDLNLRVCVGGSGAAGSWSDPVAWPRNTSSLGYKFHVRGWWPSSSLSLSGTSLNIQPTGPGAPPMSETTVCEDGGPELASNAFAKQAADTYGTSNGNKGCYGVNLYYGFTISNSPGDGNSYPFDVSLVCRGTDSAWYGASRIHVPTSFDAKGVNPINSTGAEKICKLTVDSNGNASSFMLNPATSITVIVSVANGSGSTLPVNIRLQGLLGYTGTGGGGS